MDNKKKSKIKKVVIGVLAAGIIGVGGYLAYKLLPREFEASLDSNSDCIKVTVNTSLSSKSLAEDYMVVVFDQSNKVHAYLNFDGKNNTVSYGKMHLLDGQKYTFQLLKKDKTIPSKLTWKTSNVYTKPLTEGEGPIEPTEVSILRIDPGIPDYNKKVWNNVKIIMRNESENYTYTIGKASQDNPVFNGLKPGNYEVVVVNEDGAEDRMPLTLSAIGTKNEPLTKEEVQSVFNKVTNGSLTVSEAKKILAVGPVRLAHPVQNGQITTLYELLEDAADWQTRVTVVSFELDPNTNKIRTGTLNVKI